MIIVFFRQITMQRHLRHFCPDCKSTTTSSSSPFVETFMLPSSLHLRRGERRIEYPSTSRLLPQPQPWIQISLLLIFIVPHSTLMKICKTLPIERTKGLRNTIEHKRTRIDENPQKISHMLINYRGVFEFSLEKKQKKIKITSTAI